MTATLTPSTGRVRAGKPMNFNKTGLHAGERVLIARRDGSYEIGDITAVTGLEGHMLVINGKAVFTSLVEGRVPSGTDEPALLADLAGVPLPVPTLDAAEVRIAAEEAVLRRHGFR